LLDPVLDIASDLRLCHIGGSGSTSGSWGRPCGGSWWGLCLRLVWTFGRRGFGFTSWACRLRCSTCLRRTWACCWRSRGSLRRWLLTLSWVWAGGHRHSFQAATRVCRVV